MVELVSVDASRQALKRISGVVVVAIEEHEEFCPVQRRCPALRAADKPEFCDSVSTENRASPETALSIAGKRAVLRAVVYHNALEIAESLGFERFKAFADIAFDVIRRNNDGELQQGRP